MTPSPATTLTARQQQVAQLIVQGFTPKRIAKALGISASRVRQIIGEIVDAWHLDRQRDILVQIAQRAA